MRITTKSGTQCISIILICSPFRLKSVVFERIYAQALKLDGLKNEREWMDMKETQNWLFASNFKSFVE